MKTLTDKPKTDQSSVRDSSLNESIFILVRFERFERAQQPLLFLLAVVT
jgi:hypothetical protein